MNHPCMHQNTYMSVEEQKTHYIGRCERCNGPIKLKQDWYAKKLRDIAKEPTLGTLLREYQT